MEITRTSLLTGKQATLFVPGLTQDMLDAHAAGVMAQDAFEGISADLREFLMTGITPEEWNTFLPPEEEGEDDE